jgi:hypothetical protein
MGKISKNARTDRGKNAGESKNYVKVVITEMSAKTGAFTFREKIVHKDKLKDTLQS